MPFRIRILSPGKVKLAFIREGIETYAGRIRHYAPLELAWLPVKIRRKSLPPAEILRREGEVIQKMLKPGALVVALDSHGELFSSEKLAELLEKQQFQGREVEFIIGGELGLTEEIKSRADTVLALSRMTFTHDLTRLILLEQIYRALTILKGEKYHK